MDTNALAKSEPREDIQTHTNKLLDNLEVLKKTYPRMLESWELLRWACVYHDLGKLNSKFQERLKSGKRHPDEITHGLISLAFINGRAFEKNGYTRNDVEILFHAVAYHHDRKMPFENSEVEQEFTTLPSLLDRFEYDKLPEKHCARKIPQRYFSVNKRFYESTDKDVFFRYIMIQGLLNRLDYAASAGIQIEHENDFLEDAMTCWQENNNIRWNDLQCYMRSNGNKNVIVVAQTGMGKTEAGLLWLGNHKGFFTLPLKSAINAIYKRITTGITMEKHDTRVGLLHSDTYSKYLEKIEQEEGEEVSLDDYYSKTKQLSLPLTICTLDQIFNFVFRYRGFEQKLATLSYSKVIIDEVQMYSQELIAYLVLGLHYITRMGGRFAIMTATLPPLFLDLLKEQCIPFEPRQTFTNDQIRHSLKVLDKEINPQDIIDLSARYKGKKILVVCNTIKSAVNLYRQLNIPEAQLLHSLFTKADRSKKEQQILEVGKKSSAKEGVWVATQIVEASLDIDFDLLFTELSDLSGLFQRMGRCYRKRTLNLDYNCFVFTGGGKRCSGVGAFIDEDIHELSKQALIELDGVIDEDQKISMVEDLYTKEKLPAYYNEIKKNIEYVQSISEYELSKKEAIKLFRNIDTVSVMPRGAYNAYKKEIDEAISILKKSYKGIDRETSRRLKTVARNTIANQTVSISANLARSLELNTIKINHYERLTIAECEYNDKEGVIKPVLKPTATEKDFLSRSF